MRNNSDERYTSREKVSQFLRVRSMTYAAAVHGILSREYGPLRNAPKLLAQKAQVSVRTADNWLRGVCAPRGDELIRLMSECDALRDEIFRMTQKEGP